MEAIIRMSSTLTTQVAVGLQQTKDYTVKLAANATTTLSKAPTLQKKSKGGKRANDSGLLDLLKAECVDGSWIFYSQGMFQEYLLELEEAVLSHIISNNLSLSESARIFVGVATQLNKFDDSTVIYAHSPAAQIRCCIRIIATVRPSILFIFIDNVLDIICKKTDGLTDSILPTKPFTRNGLRFFIKSLESAVPPQVKFKPLQDEIFSEIVHCNWQMISDNKENDTASVRNFAINIRHCGSTQITTLTSGYYYPLNSEDPCYENSGGYRISRSSLFLLPLIVPEDTEDRKGQYLSRSVYLWTISSPSLNSTYYSCCSIFRSSLPPCRGWRSAAHGRLPAPILALVDNIETRIGEDEKLTYQKIPLVTDFPPIESTLKFSTSQSQIQRSEHIRQRRLKHLLKSNPVSIITNKITLESSSTTTTTSTDLNFISITSTSFHQPSTAIINNITPVVDSLQTSLIALRESEHRDILSSITSLFNLQVEDNNSKSSFLDLQQQFSNYCKNASKGYKNKIKASMERITILKNVASTDWLDEIFHPAEKIKINNDDENNEVDNEAKIEEDSFLSRWSIDAVLSRERERLEKIRQMEREKEETEAEGRVVSMTGWLDEVSQISTKLFGAASQTSLQHQPQQHQASSLLFEAKLSVSEEDHNTRPTTPPPPPPISTSTTFTPSRLPPSTTIASPDSPDNGIGVGLGIKQKNRSQSRSELETHSTTTTTTTMRQVHPPKVSNDAWDCSETLDDLLRSCAAASLKRKSIDVEFLGVEMWPPLSRGGINQKLHYVIRVALNDRHCSPALGLAPEACYEQLSAYECLGLAVGRRVEAANNCSRVVFTIRRDLTSFALLHAELVRLLRYENEQGKEVCPPPFPDTFHIGMVEETFSERLRDRSGGSNSNSSSSTMGFEIYLDRRSSGEKDSDNKAGGKKSLAYAYHPNFKRKEGHEVDLLLQQCMDSLQQYVHGVLALTELFDDGCPENESSIVNYNSHGLGNGNGSRHDGDFNEEDEDSGMEIDQDEYRDTFKYMNNNKEYSLDNQLGNLVGKFLKATDLEGLLEDPIDNTSSITMVTTPAPTESVLTSSSISTSSIKQSGSNNQLTNNSKTSSELSLAELLTRSTSLTGLQNMAADNRQHPATHENVPVGPDRPCWYRYASGGLHLSLRLGDEQGGKLSLKSEEELLRAQRSKCRGCGYPISSGFFGLDKNYKPCRYTGGLFCKRWCHDDDHRIIPHRLLLYWDVSPHRVSRQAAKFIDVLWDEPLMNLTVINPQLYEGVPVLRSARALRGRVASIVGFLLHHEKFVTKEEGEESALKKRTLETIIAIIGPRIHLITCVEQYSLDDLLRTQSGQLIEQLEDLLVYIGGEDIVDTYFRNTHSQQISNNSNYNNGTNNSIHHHYRMKRNDRDNS